MGEQSNFIYFRPRQSEKYAAWIMKERRKKRLRSGMMKWFRYLENRQAAFIFSIPCSLAAF